MEAAKAREEEERVAAAREHDGREAAAPEAAARGAAARGAGAARTSSEAATAKRGEGAEESTVGRRISGQVVRQDGTAAQEWPVMLSSSVDGEWSGPRRSERTGKGGAFSFEGLAPGTYRVEAVTSDMDRQYPAEEVNLEPDADVEGIVLHLPELVVLEVAVVDVRGAAVAGAWVYVTLARDLPPVQTETDGLARFELNDLDMVVVGVSPDSEGARLFLPQYGIIVPRGQESLRVILVDAGAASGVVLSPDGDPVPRLSLSCNNDNGFVSSTSSDAEGRFRCEVPLDAPVTIFVTSHRHDPQFVAMPDGTKRRVRGELKGVRAGDQGLQLRLEWIEDGRSLTIQVLSPEGEPVAGADVELWDRKPLTRVASDARGRAAFSELTSASHTVNIIPPDGGTAKGWMRTREFGIVPAGQTVELKFRKGIRLSGTVVRPDGAPCEDAHVAVTNLSETSIEPPGHFIDCDAQGRFSFLLDPAWVERLKLRAWAKVDGKQMTVSRPIEPGEFGEPIRMQVEPEE